MSAFASKSKNSINYFTLNSEFKSLPINSALILSNITSAKMSLLLIPNLLLQNFFFFLICKSGNSHVYLVALVAFLCMSGISIFITRKDPIPVRSKTSVGFIGLLDIVYFYLLFGTGSYLSSFAFATQLQGTLFIRVFILKFMQQHSMWCSQYIGSLLALVGCILNFIFFGDRYTYLLLLGVFLHCFNMIIKRHYIKKFFVPAQVLNKYSLLFATGFGVIITPFLGLLTQEDIGNSIKNELSCLIGIDCFLMPVYLLLLLLSTVTHQFVLFKSAKELQGQRVVYMFSSIISFLGFFSAEMAVKGVEISPFMVICVVLAVVGSVIYHLYPEPAQKFSYSET